ncbi:SRPBCC family protein [Actinomadura graeca]|uniref:SRPBCC family protein n=1 Tax=Actinomadura graeca TaxID=2750812 RepID=A0ABX8QNB7_9ACTN|nr:SRPBCC family protein [Actinomadura graeca]QXJ20270.1 SRPBCC family protein [Actinomadura graeca]
MIDVTEQINSVARRVGDRVLEAGTARTVTIGRTYDTGADDLWDACTNAERIPRWFLPVSGDLRPGGRFQIEGNAGGTIERCDPPKGFSATWEFAGQTSWIEVRLIPEGDGRTRFELEHIAHADDHWDTFGPGAVGVGWDMAVLGLTLHLASGGDPGIGPDWPATDEGKEFSRLSGAAWGAAHAAADGDEALARACAQRTIAAYTGEDADTA